MHLELILAYAAIPFLVTLALSVGLAAAAYYLNRPKSATTPHANTKAEDFSLTNISSQGAMIPLIKGRARVGAIIGMTSELAVYQASAYNPGEGKGRSRRHSRTVYPTTTPHYSERAWHQICVGPATALHRIWSDGTIVFNTTITPTSHPSGSILSTITASEVFAIYWGESDQPVNTFLGSTSPQRVGVNSRWPHVCYVVWFGKQLGSSPRWPQVEYDIECNTDPIPELATGAFIHYDATVAASVEEAAGNPAENGDPVTGWLDQSGNAYDLTQTGSVCPTYRTPAGINGLAAVDFDLTLPNPDAMSVNVGLSNPDFNHQSGDVWAVVEVDAMPATDGTIFCFTRSNASQAASSHVILGITSAGAVFIWFRFNTGPVEGRVETAAGVVEVGGQYVIRFRSDGSAWSIWVNGTEHSLSTTIGTNSGGWFGDIETVAFRVGLGGASFSSGVDFHFGGRIGEVLAFDANLSAEAEERLVAYLVDKWDIDGVLSFGWGSVVESLLFDTYPHGAGLDPDEFDRESIANVSSALTAEGLTDFSAIAIEGDEVGNVIGQLLQDAGVTWVRDYANPDKQERFYIVRSEADPLSTIPASAILAPEVEIEVLHAERAIDRAIFSFSDVARNFRETTITIDEDGQALESGAPRGNIIRIGTLTDYDQAAIVAERRSQEELAGGSRFTVHAGRDARMLLPGQAFKVSGVPFVLRLVEVHLDQLSSRARLEAILDHYGTPATGFAQPDDSTGGDSGGIPAEENLRETWVEIPEHMAGAGEVNVAALRIRDHDQVRQQNIHFSADNVTYREVGIDTAKMAGGVLTSGVLASTAFLIPQGPTFDAEGPDIGDAQDLTTDDKAWRQGDQLCLIGEEVFFLQGITPLGGASYRLDGLIRARYDTVQAAHSAGDAVFIFPASGLVPFVDPFAFPGEDLYVKQQPVASDEFDLASVTPVLKTVHGKGVTPMTPGMVRAVSPEFGSPCYHSGDDVQFRWGYRSSQVAGTGAGMQPAGSAVGESDPLGEFEVSIFDAGDVLVATYTRDLNQFTYTNVQLQADLGGETDFTIQVREINGGFKSDPVELFVELV